MERPVGTKEFVLCFDGTGYKFRGNDTDSNVLKIYRMLDRNDAVQLHYYQPGFGSYISTTWLSHDPHAGRLKRWYSGVKDTALGATFGDHVMAGYKFLMRFYCPGDRIYFFGFSRGAYVARLLAEMLDHVGLLEEGNEEKVGYFWTIFVKWNQRSNSMHTAQEKKEEIFRYMKALRETFCRPVSQIRFLGLFDAVNSVPQLEMYRNKFTFPFTARTSARVVRHAVSIDERRAKFREDLMSDVNPLAMAARATWRLPRHLHNEIHHGSGSEARGHNNRPPTDGNKPRGQGTFLEDEYYRPTRRCLRQAADFRDRRGMHAKTEFRNVNSLQHPTAAGSTTAIAGQSSVSSPPPPSPPRTPDNNDESEGNAQDVEEVWFPGCHGDIGGGLILREKEDWPLSHVPLVWMVREAQRAGLQFDPDKLKQFNCSDDSTDISSSSSTSDVQRNSEQQKKNSANQTNEKGGEETGKRSEFEYRLWKASTEGRLHDFLRYHNGETWPVVLSWKIVEYIPFRRMRLQKNGSWKAVRWPLPLGGSRDIPKDATIHASAIRRMQVDSKYRPKNLIRGGRGEKKRRVPKDPEIGEWEVHAHRGCPVRETYRRKQLDETTDTPRQVAGS